MNCCRNSCVYLSIIVGIVAGVVLGILYALGFVTGGTAFLLYLLAGVGSILLSPLYAAKISFGCAEACFCRYQTLITVASIGTIIAAAIGLIIVALAPIVLVAVTLGLATLFFVMLLTSLICVSYCLCARND